MRDCIYTTILEREKALAVNLKKRSSKMYAYFCKPLKMHLLATRSVSHAFKVRIRLPDRHCGLFHFAARLTVFRQQ